MALGFSRFVCIEVLFLSIPSARYTDKADGPRRAGDVAAACPARGQRPEPLEKTPEHAAGGIEVASAALPPEGTAKQGRCKTGPRDARRVLPRIEFDDQRFLDVGTELVAIGCLLEDALELRGIDLDPVGQALAFGELGGVGDAQLLFRLLAHGDRVARLHRVR